MLRLTVSAMDRVVSILQTQPTITPYPYEQGRDAAMPIIMANTPIAHAYAKTVEITAKYGFEWDRMYRGRVKSPARVYLLARELKLMVDCVVMMLPYVVGIPDNRKIRYILEEEFEHVAPEPAADSPDRLQGMIQRWCTENADHTPLQRDANDFFKTCKNALTPAAIMEIEATEEQDECLDAIFGKTKKQKNKRKKWAGWRGPLEKFLQKYPVDLNDMLSLEYDPDDCGPTVKCPFIPSDIVLHLGDIATACREIAKGRVCFFPDGNLNIGYNRLISNPPSLSQPHHRNLPLPLTATENPTAFTIPFPLILERSMIHAYIECGENSREDHERCLAFWEKAIRLCRPHEVTLIVDGRDVTQDAHVHIVIPPRVATEAADDLEELARALDAL